MEIYNFFGSTMIFHVVAQYKTQIKEIKYNFMQFFFIFLTGWRLLHPETIGWSAGYNSMKNNDTINNFIFPGS